jgi:hypothetical protein
MRVVLDTNILISSLLVPSGNPARIYRAWHERKFLLLTCPEQLDELRESLRRPALAARIKPYRAGRLVNQLKYLAEVVLSLPTVERSPDPNDDFLLALCQAGDADYLVTGDRSGLLSLERHHRALIVSAAEFASLLEKRSF